ncbi:hypothetical protein KPL71_006429 [Citrus sinensis]|uniref:Uncharacterized protein n=1 Tax=Citrus sinensis TaxID=2711 RepID=A0ACB8LQ52_CITSI|nr:hypothetical protein KPL71_006429 [Citrus sinensis]
MEEEEQQQFTQHPEFPCSDPDNAPQSTSAEPTRDPDGLESTEPKPSFNQNDIVKALEVVERDSVAIADSFSSLFASLRLALSEVTSSSVDHMQCFSDAAGRLQESVPKVRLVRQRKPASVQTDKMNFDCNLAYW